jgi:hypothetical protein
MWPDYRGLAIALDGAGFGEEQSLVCFDLPCWAAFESRPEPYPMMWPHKRTVVPIPALLITNGVMPRSIPKNN